MTSAEIRISGLSNRKESIRNKLPFSKIEQGDVVIHSALDSETPLNDHLVWLWGALKHERRFLKNLQAEGGKIICKAKPEKGQFVIKSNAAEMLHLLNIELFIER